MRRHASSSPSASLSCHALDAVRHMGCATHSHSTRESGARWCTGVVWPRKSARRIARRWRTSSSYVSTPAYHDDRDTHGAPRRRACKSRQQRVVEREAEGVGHKPVPRNVAERARPPVDLGAERIRVRRALPAEIRVHRRERIAAPPRFRQRSDVRAQRVHVEVRRRAAWRFGSPARSGRRARWTVRRCVSRSWASTCRNRRSWMRSCVSGCPSTGTAVSCCTSSSTTASSSSLGIRAAGRPHVRAHISHRNSAVHTRGRVGYRRTPSGLHAAAARRGLVGRCARRLGDAHQARRGGRVCGALRGLHAPGAHATQVYYAGTAVPRVHARSSPVALQRRDGRRGARARRIHRPAHCATQEDPQGAPRAAHRCVERDNRCRGVCALLRSDVRRPGDRGRRAPLARGAQLPCGDRLHPRPRTQLRAGGL